MLGAQIEWRARWCETTLDLADELNEAVGWTPYTILPDPNTEGNGYLLVLWKASPLTTEAAPTG